MNDAVEPPPPVGAGTVEGAGTTESPATVEASGSRPPMEERPRGPTAERRRPPPAVSVVVPVAERPWALDRIYREFAGALGALDGGIEFVFVVKPWGREMVKSLASLAEAGEPVRVLEVGQLAGEAEMLAAAVPALRGSVVLTLPPYPRVEAPTLPALVQRVGDGVDLVTACRRLTESSTLNRLQNRAFHALLRWTVGEKFRDVASGVRAMRREVLEEVPLYGDSFRFLPLLARREGFVVEEVVVPQHPQDGQTRVYAPGIYVRRLLDLLGLVFLVRFTHKPLRFFGLVGFPFGAAGAVILIVLFFQRLAGLPLADRPLLLLGVLLFALGIQVVSIGLVGEIIVHFGASGRRLYRIRETISGNVGGEGDHGADEDGGADGSDS